jgi:FAD/FMN-containing dehydrogenase
MSADANHFLEQAAGLIGTRNVLTEAGDTAGFLGDWRGRYRGEALAVLQPATTAEVAALVELCLKQRLAMVPQAGNTGLTGGAVPPGDRPAVILNISRLNRIRDVDPLNNSLVAEAGCILANVRTVAEEHKRLFPMLLGSVGSCEIGGLVSTNAGGTSVLRYGNMRELVLGLEVVLPDGRVWNGLKALRKDNSGYDLKQLFIGAEGTLGIVTAAALKLFPQLVASGTAMVALADVKSAVELLRLLQERVGQCIEGFEIMSREQIEVVLAHSAGRSSPMPLEAPWYVLIELADSTLDWDPLQQLERTLGEALERALITDAVVATDETKAQRIWELRHSISEANKHAGFTVSNDTSVPISRLPAFVEQVTERLHHEVKACRVLFCGHVGDGNIHVIAVLSREVYATPEACEVAASAINLIVHATSVELDGSIAAEHGIGMMHVGRLERFKPALDLEMMRTIKASFDPLGLMNPGKIFRPRPLVAS